MDWWKIMQNLIYVIKTIKRNFIELTALGNKIKWTDLSINSWINHGCYMYELVFFVPDFSKTAA